jgi:hypothetical protein
MILPILNQAIKQAQLTWLMLRPKEDCMLLRNVATLMDSAVWPVHIQNIEIVALVDSR